MKTLPHDHGHFSEEIMLEMPRGESFETVSELFKMLCDAKRMQIFWLLCHCEECVINISAIIDASSPVVSHHLKLLKTAGLITSRRSGKEVYYTASGTPRAELLHGMIEGMVEATCPAEKSVHTDDSALGVISDLHALLTRDLSRRYTIEELSSIFHINKTTLKAVFKTVFGSSIGSYMKEYRIKRAKELLSGSDASVGEIAASLGYENQSKFTSAFSGVVGLTPREYRKKTGC